MTAMKTLLALVLSLSVSMPVQAANEAAVANMNSWCECVMAGGVCQVANSPPLKPGSRIWTSSGPIDAALYASFRNDPMMCQRGRQACSANWDSPECRQGFRLMFRQTPMVCLRPGEPQAR